MLVAIPKQTRCGECGDRGSTSGSAPAPIKTEQPVTPGVSLASPTKSAFRISKSGGRPSSRRQSCVNEAADRLERMDPTTYHIMGNGFPNAQALTEHGHVNFEAHQTFQPPLVVGIDPTLSPMYQAPYAYPIPTMPPPTHNGSMGMHPPMPLMNGNLAPGHGTGTPERTAGYSSEASSATFTPASGTGSASLDAMPAPPQRSCCAPKVLVKNSTDSNDFDPVSASNIGMQFPQQALATAPQSHGLYQNSANACPLEYGTYANPLGYSQWEQMGSYGYYPVAPDAMAQGNCACGKDCNCLGCSMHPFNESTREYASEAYQLQHQDNWITQPDEMPSSAMQEGASPFATTSSTPEAAEAGSFTASSKEGSPNPDSSHYFFINIPCRGKEADCACGDNCMCEGCTIHHQEAMQNMPPEETNTTQPKDFEL
ncbi:copper-activated transcription factor [Apiospora marii]|uniref:Copper-activated transcription factor n=1 Tax=Apiospora marii TaxID=335849 RepID=A0ABR1RGS3_9PEZI